MRAPALAPSLLLLLAGCPSPGPCVLGGAREAPPAQAGWEDDSSPVTVVLSALQGFACTGEGPVASSVKAEVLSPTNAVVPVTVKPELDGTGAVTAASLTFTPTDGPGVYLVTATFLPVGGRPSLQVLVVDDRRDGPHALLPRSCRTLAGLPSGAWVCDGVPLGAGAGATPLFSADWEVAAAGSTLWAHGGNTLKAWRELDGVLQPAGEFASGDIFRVLALEDRALLFSSNRTQVVSFSDGGLQLDGELPAVQGSSELSARDGRLFAPDPAVSADSAGNLVNRVCALPLAPGQASPDTCTELRGKVVGGWEGSYLTSETNVGTTLRAWAPTPDGRLLLTDTLLLPSDLTLLDPSDGLFSGHWPQVADLLTNAALVAKVRGGSIVLERFSPMPNGFTSRHDLTWGALADGGTGAWSPLP
jgi:hypothetical protein